MTDDRFIRTLRTIRLITASSKKVNLANLKKKYGFVGNRAARVHFNDINRSFTFRFDESQGILCLEALRNVIMPQKADVDIYIRSLCVLKHVRSGSITGYEPGTLRKMEISYSPLDAWKFGDVQAYGDSSTNDVLAFVNLLREVMEVIDPKELDGIVGACDHD